MWRHASAFVLWILVISPPARGEITWTLELIADSGMAMPDSASNFRYLSKPAIEGSTIAFLGSDGVGHSGIYRWDGSSLRRVADSTMAVPGSAERFMDFGDPAIAGSDIIFNARSSTKNGVYRWRGGALSIVVDETQTLPGMPEPRPFIFTAARGSSLYVQTSSALGGPGSIHRIEPGPPEAVAITGTAAPGGVLGELRPLSTDGTTTAFVAGYAGESRNVLMMGEPGKLTVIAEPGTPVPNGQVEALDLLVLQGQRDGRIAFVAKPVGLPESVYVWDAGQIELAIEGTDSPRGGDPFDEIHYVGLADGALVVIGRTGLHIKSGDQQAELLDYSTLFQGRRIAGLYFGPGGVTGRAAALKVVFGDGTEGILRLDFSITPSGTGTSGGGSGGGSGSGGGGGGADMLSVIFLAIALIVGSCRRKRSGWSNRSNHRKA